MISQIPTICTCMPFSKYAFFNCIIHCHVGKNMDKTVYFVLFFFETNKKNGQPKHYKMKFISVKKRLNQLNNLSFPDELLYVFGYYMPDFALSCPYIIVVLLLIVVGNFSLKEYFWIADQ